jgi:putative ABC transport system permease protein
MLLFSLLREGVRFLRRNKTRSTLTVLGITIGIAAVICVVAIGNAGSAQIQDQLQNLGDNLVWIEAGGRAPNGVRTGTHGTKTLLVSDAEAIAKQTNLVKAVSPQSDGRTQVVFGNTNWSTQYRGEGPAYIDIKRWNIASGANFSDEDVTRAANVCVIGHTVQQQLFGAQNPIGATIRVGTIPCQVIGTLATKGYSSFGQDQDDFILMPYTTVMKKLNGNSWLDDIMCSAVSAEMVPIATDQLTTLLRERHRIQPGQDDDFNIRRPEEQVQAQLDASRTFTFLLVGIASVSLLVGGIGIMNVMLVSVTERTREIGIRLAVGATEWNVQAQFLGEAVLLSLFGGALGVGLGFFGSLGIGRALDWPMMIPPSSIAVAVLFSVFVGVFFGYYPARRAAQLDPIEALRFE